MDFKITIHDDLWRDLRRGDGFKTDEEKLLFILAMAVYKETNITVNKYQILSLGKMKVTKLE